LVQAGPYGLPQEVAVTKTVEPRFQCAKCESQFRTYVQFAMHDCVKHREMLKRLKVAGK